MIMKEFKDPIDILNFLMRFDTREKVYLLRHTFDEIFVDFKWFKEKEILDYELIDNGVRCVFEILNKQEISRMWNNLMEKKFGYK